MNKVCNLCNLEFKSDDQFKQHLDGKKHKKLETIREERQKSAQRSLFVSNLKPDTFTKQLEDHFAQFGPINKIVIDPAQNAYAIVEFDNDESVENALKHTGAHRVNGRNLKCKRREVKEFVSTISKGTDRKKKALDQLKQESLEINTVLAKCESFDGQIEELVNHLESKPEEKKAKEEVCEELKHAFRNVWSENEYDVKIFGSTASNLTCKRSDMDLTLLLKDYFPDNERKQQKLPPYIQKQLKEDSLMRNAEDDNSNSNNQNEELEESIDLDEEDDDEQRDEQDNGETEDKENKEHNEQLRKAMRSFFVEKNYKLFNQFEVEQQMKIIAKIIERFHPNVKFLKTIISARCPVVRFFDTKAQVFCDFSLNNYLAVENTNLIEVYLELEPSLRKMIYLIRYWAKQKNLSGSNRFNTYTLIWLILFYLQSKKVLNLPTVARLAELKGEVKEIHGWNCAFETNIQKINALKTDAVHSSNQNLTFNDLLKGFFDFYSNFDFASFILCTRSAHALRRDEKTDLPKLSSFINIQDAFELNHNLTANISKNTMERFKVECKGSWELLNNPSLMKKSSNKCWGLILLTTKKALPLSPSNNKTEKMNKEQVENKLLKLKLFDEEKAPSAESTKKNPKDFVIFLLKDCLLFEPLLGDKVITKRKKRLRVLNQICHQVDSLGLNCSPKRLKINDNNQQDGLVNKPTFVCVFDENNNGNNKSTGDEEDVKLENSFQFNTNLNTWQGRRSVKRELRHQFANVNEIELEKMTSQRIHELNLAKPEPHKKSMNFSIQFLSFPQKSQKQQQQQQQASAANEDKQSGNLQIKLDILDEIQSEQELLEFKSLFHFLQTYMNNSYEKIFDLWSDSQVGSNNQMLTN